MLNIPDLFSWSIRAVGTDVVVRGPAVTFGGGSQSTASHVTFVRKASATVQVVLFPPNSDGIM